MSPQAGGRVETLAQRSNHSRHRGRPRVMKPWLGRPVHLPRFQNTQVRGEPPTHCRARAMVKTKPHPHTQVALFSASGRTVLLEAPAQSRPNTCACAQPSRATKLPPSHAPICSFNWSFTRPWASGYLPLIPPPTETSRSELRAHFPPTFWI